jgi:imidazolonepropionase-like amidohydrolase
MAANLEEAFRAGVTAVRDLGSLQARNIELQAMADARRGANSPTVQACGHVLTYPGGHCAKYGIEIRGSAAAREAVRMNAALGARCIKVTNDPEDTEARGRLPEPTFTVAEYSAIVDEAHKAGMRVAAHTFPSIAGMEAALNAGVDSIEHGTPLTDSILSRLIDARTVLVPTVVAAIDEFPDDALGDRWETRSASHALFNSTNFPKRDLHRIRGNIVPESIVVWYDRMMMSLDRAISADVLIGIGTDAGCKGTNFRSAVREMFALTKLGATNAQVLRYATVNGATALGEEGNRGTIRPGMIADLVFVKANPLAELETLLNPIMVVARGHFPPDAPVGVAPPIQTQSSEVIGRT